MKKVLLIVLTLAMIFSVAGCATIAEKAEDTEKLNDASEKLENAITSTDDAGNIDMDKLDDAINDYNDALDNMDGSINNGMTVQEYVDKMKDDVSDQSSSMFNVSIEAEGNNLVYNYNYLVETADNAKEAMDAQMESTKDTFESIADAIRKECSAVEKVVYKYFDMNGNLISSYEF